MLPIRRSQAGLEHRKAHSPRSFIWRAFGWAKGRLQPGAAGALVPREGSVGTGDIVLMTLGTAIAVLYPLGIWLGEPQWMDPTAPLFAHPRIDTPGCWLAMVIGWALLFWSHNQLIKRSARAAR